MRKRHDRKDEQSPATVTRRIDGIHPPKVRHKT
jgi:hypothetical protein